MRLTSLSRSTLLGDRMITSCPFPDKFLIAGRVVPSPSRLLIMKTGEPRLILGESAFVTAWRGIDPEGETEAKRLRILYCCLSPESGGRKSILLP